MFLYSPLTDKKVFIIAKILAKLVFFQTFNVENLKFLENIFNFA